MTKEEIAQAALGLTWWDVESQARRVCEWAEEYMRQKSPSELCRDTEVKE